MTIFTFGGRGVFWNCISETLRLGLYDNFHFRGWGYSETLRLGFYDNFHFWGGRGVFWNSQTWTLWQFSFWGGYSETLGLGLSDNFHFRGGILKLYFRMGGFCRIWTKISTTPAGSCITDSLSHTTYVETNKFPLVRVERIISIRSPSSLCLAVNCVSFVRGFLSLGLWKLSFSQPMCLNSIFGMLSCMFFYMFSWGWARHLLNSLAQPHKMCIFPKWSNIQSDCQ